MQKIGTVGTELTTLPEPIINTIFSETVSPARATTTHLIYESINQPIITLY